MKQEVISHISTIKDELFKLSKYIYDNPEESFQEHKAYSYIINLLKNNGFKVTESFLDIPTAFYAEFGSGHPKICYLCEYDALSGKGHITGHNLVTTMSIGAALGLSNILPKLHGTVIIIGCPGEYAGGAKVDMAKQGVFDDMDAALMAHPDIITAQSGTSSAILPLGIKFYSRDGLSYLNKRKYSSLDACLFTFNSLNLLMKGFPEDVTLDGIIANGGHTPAMIPEEAEARFYIRSNSMKSADSIEDKLRELVKTTSYIMGVKSDVTYYELPYNELITNQALSRIFSHNLKENGIIDCKGIKNTDAGLSLGTVSHYVPAIHPYISISEDKTLQYPSEEFARTTLSSYAQERTLQAAHALAITGLDIIQSENILSEIKNEFYENHNK